MSAFEEWQLAGFIGFYLPLFKNKNTDIACFIYEGWVLKRSYWHMHLWINAHRVDKQKPQTLLIIPHRELKYFILRVKGLLYEIICEKFHLSCSFFMAIIENLSNFAYKLQLGLIGPFWIVSRRSPRLINLVTNQMCWQHKAIWIFL